jgi:hypothetical protein
LRESPHENVRDHHAEQKEDAQKQHLIGEGRRDGMPNQVPLHTHMDIPCLAGQDRGRNVDEIPLILDLDLLDHRLMPVFVQPMHFVRYARHEGMGNDLAALVLHEDVVNALDLAFLQVLFDHGLDGGGIAEQEEFDAGPRDAVGDGLALFLVLLGQVAFENPRRDCRRGKGGDAEQHDQNGEGLGEQAEAFHRCHLFHSWSRRGTKRCSTTTE